jgi:hypothetical protein
MADLSTLGFLDFLTGLPLIDFIVQGAGLHRSFTVIAIISFTTTILATKIKMD